MATEVTVHITFREHGEQAGMTRYGARAALEPGETWEAAAQRVAGAVLDEVDDTRREEER